jgi:hypothetical protein
MSCFSCNGCTPTQLMRGCYASVIFGQFANGSVTLTFTNTSDGSVSQATGTAAGGSLTILAEDLPSFVNGVNYNVKASATWTLGGTIRDCVTIQFKMFRDAEGAFLTGTAETVTVCS